MSPEIATILMIVAMLAGISLGHPLGFVLGGVGILFGFFLIGPQFFPVIALSLYTKMSNYILVAVPLFILMGSVIEASDIGEDIYSGMYMWFGGLRGGLALGTIAICTLLAASTGIIATAIIGIGIFALPAMLKRGYSKQLATGCVAAGGSLGILIPPSIMLVLYGAEAALSVGKLFAAAIFPGLMLSVLYMLYITLRCAIHPELGPAISGEEGQVPLKIKLLFGLKSVAPPFFLVVVVLGSIFAGIATPTEAAGVGALGALILTAIYRRLNPRTLKRAVSQTLKITSMAMLLVAGAATFVNIFLAIGGGEVIKNALMGLGFGPWGILAVIMFILLILGMFMDWIGILLLAIPIFVPVAKTLGFDPLWFALIVCVNLQISFLSPPYGPALFYTRAVSPEDVTMLDIYKGGIPFIALQILVLALCIIFPSVILWLPSILIK